MNQGTDRICRWNRHFLACGSSTQPSVCTPRAKFSKYPVTTLRITLASVFQRVKQIQHLSFEAQKTVEGGLKTTFWNRLIFSHSRTKYPSAGWRDGVRRNYDRAGIVVPKKVIDLDMSYAHYSRTEDF